MRGGICAFAFAPGDCPSGRTRCSSDGGSAAPGSQASTTDGRRTARMRSPGPHSRLPGPDSRARKLTGDSAMMIATANLARPFENVSAASATPATSGGPRFTLDGNDELEQHLDEACRMVLEGVRSIIPEWKLDALLLGGGYGRGQGGVLRTEAGDRPYNDLEFYVFLRGNTFLNEQRYRAALRDLAEELTPVSGVEVEFKIHSLAKLRRSPVTMFYYDLMLGHRRLWGGKQILAGCQGHREPKNIPLSEATRLL